MSEQLTVCLTAVVANLVAMLLIYAVMAQLLGRLAWRGRGILGVILTIIVAQLLWIAPAFLIVRAGDPDNAAVYALWFGNWLVCGFAVVLLWQAAKRIPRQLGDGARLDGLSSFAIWRHVIFPFVKRELILLALFTVMATLLPFWAFINLPDADRSIVLFERFFSPQGRIAMMATGSLIGAVPVIAAFFLARRSPAAR
jgi:ABC-type glycerol-3-phosphate transport system permease component